ncbi:MAG: amidohydrolase family protein [Acidimicrobiales bacterium]
MAELSELIIDVDTHITEPPDTWTSRAPGRFKDKVPYVAPDPKGRLCWWVQGQRMGVIGMTATAGWADPNSVPNTYEEMHPAAYDAAARLEYMDSLGIWAQVLYPNVAGFGNQAFLKLGDPELMLACVEAYNDFQTEWASADSRRLLPVASTPFWDVKAAVREVERCAEMGHRGILFTGEPQSFGQPYLGDRHWDPLWAAAQERRLPISFHIGSGDMEKALGPEKMKVYGMKTTFTAVSVDLFLHNGTHLTELLLSGILTRFPELQFVSVESGIGWVPFMLEALDYQFQGNDLGRARPEFELLPSEYFARNVFACYWFEQTGPQRLIDKVGADRVLFETDFPHPTCLYGAEVAERIEGGLADVDPDVRRKILWDNAAALYQVEAPVSA